MKIYVISLAVGLLVGLIYGILDVRSPAPPMVALVGLVGILLGEQAIPVVKKMLQGQPITVAICTDELRAHTFARLPGVNDLKAKGADR